MEEIPSLRPASIASAQARSIKFGIRWERNPLSGIAVLGQCTNLSSKEILLLRCLQAKRNLCAIGMWVTVAMTPEIEWKSSSVTWVKLKMDRKASPVERDGWRGLTSAKQESWALSHLHVPATH